MLSYRHGFHAGNPADVFKHSVLLTLIRAMQEKPAGITFLDTHAGPSRYDLGSEWALKTREFEPGIARLWTHRSEAGLLQDYLGQIARLNPDGRLRFYPGSPRLIANLLRPVDRLIACELHPSEQERLADEFIGDRQVRVYPGDGYRALLEVLPPPTGRGLVLVDPSYELKDEIETMTQALAQALRRFSHGVYAIWYPKIEGRDIPIESLPDRLGLPEEAWLDLSIDLPPEQRLGRMWGTGMAVINPPWRARRSLAELMEGAFGIRQERQGSAG
jgi:23S rRNA (adenine2030-N6)-methyltransferase